MIVSRRGVVAGGVVAGLVVSGAADARVSAPRGAERWGLFEITLDGGPEWTASAIAPLNATFTHANRQETVAGYWDGAGRYRVRYMPDQIGAWSWTIQSDIAAFNQRSGGFTVGPPLRGNHGPVGVVERYHFAYADGTPFRQIGTTSYAWAHQPEARCTETLRALAASPFNKIRMAVFPNAEAPREALFPYAAAGEGWNFDRFNPAFFQNIDRRVSELGALGIEADLILFHPYDDRRGFSAMSPEHDERYVRYLIARLSAHRNVWWSMANEWDLVKAKTESDFDTIFRIVEDADPYQKLRSIHQWRELYDHNKPWVSHASIQNGAAVEDDARALLYRDVYRKPVIFDEVRYEGDTLQRWGNLAPQEMVRAFWEAHIAGCYCGHGEAYRPDLFIGVGGTLRGESLARLRFLKRIMEEGPAPGIDPLDRWWGRHFAGKAGHYVLRYFADEAPRDWRVGIPKDELAGGERFRIDVIDTWNMSVTTLADIHTVQASDGYSFADPAHPTIPLPGLPWMAVRMVRV